VWSSKYLRGFPRTNLSSVTAARLPVLPRPFRLADILAPLDRLVAETNGLAGKQEDFWIPYEEGSIKPAGSDTLALITGWILGHADEFFAARSWPWTLLREACLTAQGKARYTDEALTGIYESKETGPLGYLAIAEVLSHFQPLLARKFAARGLERLSAADFRRDCRLFLEGSAISSQCCQRVAANLGALDEEQAATLAKLQSPARGEFIQETARRLRATKDQPVLEALAPALDTYWEQELKEQVANAFKAQAFDPLKAFEEGLAAYQAASPDLSKAAKLFRQAAARSHPGAQYYLAMIYERGAGVPKDLAVALDWYGQSATNGYAEAAVALGN
jgi:Sel1 repeat